MNEEIEEPAPLGPEEISSIVDIYVKAFSQHTTNYGELANKVFTSVPVDPCFADPAPHYLDLLEERAARLKL